MSAPKDDRPMDPKLVATRGDRPLNDRPMVATYRLQLTKEFDFDAAREQLPYLQSLGVSHLYLSPITEATPGSQHGYDVTDHNSVREELGGREGFERLREAAVDAGLELILDIVPNHSGVGSGNEAWQDLLAYGPHSEHARTFDIDWEPPEPMLRGKLLLPFLGRPYGEALDEGELRLGFDGGYFHALYYDNRFRLTPFSYDTVLSELLPRFERREEYFDLLELRDRYAELQPGRREHAEALKGRLADLLAEVDAKVFEELLAGEKLHLLLEEQFWRLAYWQTAGDEINYRRFFDVNGLAALRMEEPGVFWDNHRLIAELVLEEGVAGLRVDHIDGLVDPHSYLDLLAGLGPGRIWVEKILAAGEALPGQWPVSGTTGYEFMNDALRVLIPPQAEEPLLATYRRFTGGFIPYREEAIRCKQLLMETSLAAELNRLAGMLNRISESDYRTRDFTMPALGGAMKQTIAAFERYRTYLPHDPEEAKAVLRRAVSEAKRRAENIETSVYEFLFDCLSAEPDPENAAELGQFVGRFQQYTAPVAAKGIEDTAFYRFVPLAALNEVGGEPDLFAIEPQAFHSRARFRQHRYPENLLTTATHDHKRGEEVRMRLAALAQFTDEWDAVAERLAQRSQRYWRETGPLGARRAVANDTYLFFQHLLALWGDGDSESLAERLSAYLLKAVREAKQETSWISPDSAYEEALSQFVASMTNDEEVADALAPLAGKVAYYGLLNSLAQLVLKLTSPGVPDFYQGAELTDLSLVDPDNRRPVDFDLRRALAEELDSKGAIDHEQLLAWLEGSPAKLRLHLIRRLLRFRREHPAIFSAPYHQLDRQSVEDDGTEDVIAYFRENEGEQMLVVVPRFHAMAAETPARPLTLPAEFHGNGWREVVTQETVRLGSEMDTSRYRLLPAVLHRVVTGSGE